MARQEARGGYVRIAALLKQARLDAGLRQTDVSEQLKQPQSFVSKYESAERCLTLIELKQVCGALGISLCKFVERFESDSK